MAAIRCTMTCVMLAIAYCAYSQENRYMVFFKDKTGTPYTVNQPSQFLSQRSIDRRVNQGINITESDLPVSPTYVNQVAQTGSSVLYTSRWFNGLLVEATTSEINAVQALGFVQSVEFVAPGKNGTGGRKNSSAKTTEMAYLGNGRQNEMLGLDAMHQDGYDGDGFLVAVFDSGFQGVNTADPFAHLFSNGSIWDSHNFAHGNDQVFAYDNHGTQVLSTIAAYVWPQYIGGAHKASFVLYVTEYLPTEYRVEEFLWAFAAERADSVGVDIISSSLGYSEFDDPGMDYNYDDLDGNHAITSKAAQWAFERGIVVVNAAGNTYPGSDWARITPPADGENVLAVGSVNYLQERALSSLIGPNARNNFKPDAMALGAGAWVIDSDGSLTTSNGTSMACPQITSLAAGVWQMNPEFTAGELIQVIRKSGSRYFKPDNFYGFGIPNYRAIKNILSFPTTSDKISLFPNPVTEDVIQIAIDPTDGSTVNVVIADMLGQRVLAVEYDAHWLYNPFSINISALVPGAYLARIRTDAAERTFRFVKR